MSQIIKTQDKVALSQRMGAIEQEQQIVQSAAIKALDQKAVNAAFKEFVDKPLPNMSHYSLSGEYVVLEVFCFIEKSSILQASGTSMERKHTFSIGKVLTSGDKSAYKPGDFVKLKDYDTSTIVNPNYEAWTNNPYTKSNASRVGQEPEPYLQNLWVAHGPKLFRVNPLKQELTDSDWLTFKFADANIECKLDPNVVLAL